MVDETTLNRLDTTVPNGLGGQTEKFFVDESIREVEISVLERFRQAGPKRLKTFWFILFLAGTAILLWQIYKTIDNYIYSPIISTYTITPMKRMDFPNIYVCPTSLTSAEFLNSTSIGEQEIVNLKEEMGAVWDYIDFLARSNLSNTYSAENTIHGQSRIIPRGLKEMVVSRNVPQHSHHNLSEKHIFDPQTLFVNGTIPMDKHIRYCEFRTFNYEKNIPCATLARQVFDPDYGRCFIVNVGTRQQEVQSQGLYLALNVQVETFPTNSSLTPIFTGFVISVQNEYNNIRSGTDRVFVSPPSYNRIDLAVQRQGFKSFNRPYKQKCTDPANFEFQIFNVNYSDRYCTYDCVARALRVQCDCLPPIDRRLYKPTVLNQTQDFCMGMHLPCIRQKVHENPEVITEIDRCRDHCHISCNHLKYDIRTSSADFHPPAFEKGMPWHNLMYVIIAFSRTEYTQYTQDYSVTPDGFISKVGGEFNLW